MPPPSFYWGLDYNMVSNMNYNHLLISLLLLLAGPTLTGQGISFFEGTWEETLDEARRQDKLIFVDAYAVWCGPCKKMTREVFPRKEVGDFFNRFFVNVKLDMERGEGLKFRELYPVSAFPTLFFIDAGGELVYKAVGAKGPDQLIKLGQFALNKIDDSGDYARRFEEGDRDPEMVLRYISALNKSGQSSLKVVNTYLNEQEDPGREENLRIIYEGTTEADSRVFDLLIRHRAKAEALFGADAVADRIEVAASATLVKAITFNMEALYTEAVEVVKIHLPDRAKAFAIDADMKFFEATGQSDAYLKACLAYSELSASKDPAAVANLAHTLSNRYSSHKNGLKTAIRMAELATKHATSFEPPFVLAQLHKKAGDKKKARKAAEKALDMPHDNPNTRPFIEQFIQEL
jgi:thioredoxin-related protein